MNITFKNWIKLWETLDPNVKAVLLQAKWPANKEEIEKAIEELEADPTPHDKKSAFSILQSKFIKKKDTEIKEPTEPVLKTLYDKLQKKQITVPEYKTAVYFLEKEQNSMSFQQSIDEMMTLLRNFISQNNIELIFKEKPKIRFMDQVISNYDDITQFMAILHGIEGQVADAGETQSEKGLQNPAFLELENKADLVSKGKNIWVFKGDDPLKCRLMGKGQRWCISSSDSVNAYFNYRNDYGQTQYFIFDFNKAPNDPARYVNPGVAPQGQYSEWVDRRNVRGEKKDNVSFAVNGYDNLQQYLDYLKSMGIDTSVFKAEPLTQFETEIQASIYSQDVDGVRETCKKETEKVEGICRRMFYFLKLSNNLFDNKFTKLTDDEKLIYLIGKKVNSKAKAKFLAENKKALQAYLSNLSYSAVGYSYDNLIENFIIEMSEYFSPADYWEAIKTMKGKVNLADVIQILKRSKTEKDMDERLKLVGEDLVDMIKNDPDVYKNLGTTYISDKILNMSILGGHLIDKLYELLGKDTFRKHELERPLYFHTETLNKWIQDPEKLEYLAGQKRGTDYEKMLESLKIIVENGGSKDAYLKLTKAIIDRDKANNKDWNIIDNVDKLRSDDIYKIISLAPYENLDALADIIGRDYFENLDEWQVRNLVTRQNSEKANLWFIKNFSKFYPQFNFVATFSFNKPDFRKEFADVLIANKPLTSDEVRGLLQIYRFYFGDTAKEKFIDEYIGKENMNNITDDDLVKQLSGTHWNGILAISPEWWATKDAEIINKIVANLLQKFNKHVNGINYEGKENIVSIFKAFGDQAVAKIDPVKVQELVPDLVWAGAFVKSMKRDYQFL